MNYKMKQGSRENDTIGPFRGDSIVNKRFKGPGDVPRTLFHFIIHITLYFVLLFSSLYANKHLFLLASSFT